LNASKAWENEAISEPFTISVLINQTATATALIDTGCTTYGLISSQFARKHKLARVPTRPRKIIGFDSRESKPIEEIAYLKMDIGGYIRDIYLYIAPKLGEYDLILGLPWMKALDISIQPKQCTIRIKGQKPITIQNERTRPQSASRPIAISAIAFKSYTRQKQKVQIFAASLADIQKALRPKEKSDPYTKLPLQYHEYLDIFDQQAAEKLPPLRGAKIDHKIELNQVDGKPPEVPWGPLYSMSRDELLVLRKTLTDLLDKGFIRVSNSPAAAPVLFVRKPGGGLRFCVDYRGLNKITRKDRYPLPLIHETLRNIGQSKWFTKLDVIAAFHKIRIDEGSEWMTAFRTRYGLYEWLVTPFGLANAPSTFQRYINWALRDFLDEFCSAYIDDILIYTDGSIEQHRDQVRKVLNRLREAGLQIDIDKCEFEVQTTKYLGFIIEAGRGIKMDPEKIKAIQEWEVPKSIKGVQSFLGFANFYRRFISNFSDYSKPLLDTIKRDSPFKWTDDADIAFKKLKVIFTTAPILEKFDYKRKTVLETDASEWCIGGTLMQYGEDGVLRPCAYYSKKNLPAECNYEIYDKEMLAIIRCLEEWDAELRSVRSFEIRTDHKNLEYFMSVRKLTERQMRWSLELSRYNFDISYIKGKSNERADALSRREQDIPIGGDDRLQYRMVQLLEKAPGRIIKKTDSPIKDKDIIQAAPIQLSTLKDEWDQTQANDDTYIRLRQAIKDGARVFPIKLGIHVSISECSLDQNDRLLFRGRHWVPNSESLRTRIIQETHDSAISGHPGREGTAALLIRQFFWPNMLQDIRRFIRNCDICNRNKAWRERRYGFLKPLPVPNQIWSELSIDFITDLPISDGCTYIMVVTDRLSKSVVFEPCPDITIKTVVEKFLRLIYRNHGLPKAIVSDRGAQFISLFWSRLCDQLGITRRLSTAYHPETDGSTERMNQTLEAYLRTYINYEQDNWANLLYIAELAINNRDAASTGISPFFLTHGYYINPIEIDQLSDSDRTSPILDADRMLKQLKEAREYAEVAIIASQQEQEKNTNIYRQQAPAYKIGDKVWLNLSNIRTKRANKKLDWKNGKFTVIEVIGSHNYRLNTPPGIHNVFHTRLLKPAATDPLDSQVTDDIQPEAIEIDGDQEWEIEEIQKQRTKRKKKELLVKWKGYAQPTWEPYTALEDTVALDIFERRQRGGGSNVMG